MEGAMAFCGLDAATDLRGNPLRNAPRSRASLGSSGGPKSSEWGKEGRSEEADGRRRSGRLSTGFGMRGHSQFGGSRTQSGNDCITKVEEEETDTAMSPSKPRWSSSKRGSGDVMLAEKIRRHREEEENARRAR